MVDEVMDVPHEVKAEGYTIEEIKKAFTAAQQDQPTLAFTKKPSLEFYKKLHWFLRNWSFTRDAGKTAIGKFYLAIDPYLQQRKFLPHNAYRFISQQTLSDQRHLQYDSKRSSESADDVEICKQQIEDMGEKLLKSQKETIQMRQALSDIENKMQTLKVSYEKKLQNAYKENNTLSKECLTLEYELQNFLDQHASENITELSDEINILSRDNEVKGIEHTADLDIHYHTKTGKIYSVALRKLYYRLLVSGMAPSKIAPTIKTILNHFLPNINGSKISLPKASCAQYMRREELKTVNDIHKATKLTENVTHMHLNSDGTTLKQHKIGAATINGLVLSVNELSNSSAEQIANDISKELEHLRRTAEILELPNAKSINWSLVASATSDSASTQKKFNEIVKKLREEDAERFGQASLATSQELVSNFCAMHLGVNLRKAFLQGSESEIASETSRQYSQTDTTVHEFCKLFGIRGVPEYGVGAVSFPNFLAIAIKSAKLIEESNYYQLCQSMTLERQVGSRYFVTASNAVKVVFLRKAAFEYLNEFRKNTLEKDVYQKLQDSNAMAGLKADGLMFLHIYADLVTLAKSQEFKKSALDMNIHYLELNGFLEHLEENPSIAFNPNIQVFPSESRLYNECVQQNHRMKPKNKLIYSYLFTQDKEWDQLVEDKLSKGAATMRLKLKSYAKDYLPGGKYWDPPEVKTVLKEIKPSNDICESILGLNDWLENSMPSISQLTKRNLIEAKKNDTLSWLDTQSRDEQYRTISLAVKEKVAVKENYKQHKKVIEEERQKAMMKMMQRQSEQAEKLRELKADLSGMLVINNVKLLDKVLLGIERDEHLNVLKKTKKKMELLKVQVKLRKVVYNQETIKLNFTKAGKKIPLAELVDQYKCLIEKNPISDKADYTGPKDLVGKDIWYRFFDCDSKDYSWFRGFVLAYDEESDKFEIAYEDEEEHCFFNLLVDYSVGDLKIIK